MSMVPIILTVKDMFLDSTRKDPIRTTINPIAAVIRYILISLLFKNLIKFFMITPFTNNIL